MSTATAASTAERRQCTMASNSTIPTGTRSGHLGPKANNVASHQPSVQRASSIQQAKLPSNAAIAAESTSHRNQRRELRRRRFPGDRTALSVHYRKYNATGLPNPDFAKTRCAEILVFD